MSVQSVPHKYMTASVGSNRLARENPPLQSSRLPALRALGGAAAIFVTVVVMALWAQPAAAGGVKVPSTSNQPPRKVIVGTAMQAFWGEYPGLEKRLEQLGGIVDQMVEESKRKYGRSMDLAVLPEVAVTGEVTGEAVESSVPFEGRVKEAFARKAQEHQCYIVVPMYLLEDKGRKICSNVAILVGRKGEVVGTYRKLHLAVPVGSDSMEGGMTPGKEVPVFDCDFGKLGMQICFDMEYDYGWDQLARKGAELVAWPTQSPQTAQPAFRAMRHRYYIVSSTWRNNASIFEPTGRITAQIKPPEQVLVQEIDLSYALLPWSKELRNGEALREKYGDKVGFRYYEDEDRGIFWSNDPSVTIGQMVRSIGVAEEEDEFLRIQRLFHKAGVPGS
ncbi:MAG TPA: carbon-nitrogen hydrolase family protein [Terriglobia bacterium]|nr:carbon-nitrogen hydrolase family protein [Terriglobia bacterium]